MAPGMSVFGPPSRLTELAAAALVASASFGGIDAAFKFGRDGDVSTKRFLISVAAEPSDEEDASGARRSGAGASASEFALASVFVAVSTGETRAPAAGLTVAGKPRASIAFSGSGRFAGVSTAANEASFCE